ncbi:MAG: ATP-binding protein [Croceibacterium sp.]
MTVQLDTLPQVSGATVGDLLAQKLLVAVGRHAAFGEACPDLAPAEWHDRFSRWCTDNEGGREWTHALAAAAAQAEARSHGAARRRLVALFRLDAAERDLLDSALALAACPALAPELSRFGGLTEQAVIALFGHPNRPIMRPTSPLAVWALIERDGRELRIDPDIASLVAERPGLDRRLAECAQVIEPTDILPPGWPVGAIAEAALRLCERGRAARVVVAGLPGSGRQLFAAAVAATLSSRVVCIAPDRAARDDDLYMRAQRLALLTGNALYWDGPMPPHPPGLASAPLQFVATLPHQTPPPVAGLADLWAEVPAQSYAEKLALWQAIGGARTGVTLERCGQVLGAARLGDLLALAAQAPEDEGTAREALARRIRGRIGGSGNLLGQPYARTDLVLAPATTAQFATILGELSARERLLNAPGLADHYGGLGQSILFHGAPGTGKTMAARVLARELGAELLRVDCASIVSKYVGDTVKQLRELFDRVAGSGAIVLFDEADTLFAKRTELRDAHDRHANADTNYLLQLIEDFDGVAILATNRKENLDPAFLRRLRYVVEFGELGSEARARLWQRHLDALVGEGSAMPGWAAKLATAELSPAQIKGAALTGHFVRDSRGGGRARLSDFVTGIEREFAKDGRAVDAALRGRLDDA